MIIAILANKSSAKNPWNNIVGIKYNKEQTLNKKLNLFLMLLIEMSAKNELSAVQLISLTNLSFFLNSLISRVP